MRGEPGGGTLSLLAAALTCAVTVGLVVVTATVLLVDTLGARPENLTLRLYLLFGGTVGGILIATWATWRLLGPIASSYRRGGLAIVSGFATVLLMLVCIPINQLFGRTGLLMLLGLSAGLSLLFARRAKQLGAGA